MLEELEEAAVGDLWERAEEPAGARTGRCLTPCVADQRVD